jgi:hypothetical protein
MQGCVKRGGLALYFQISIILIPTYAQHGPNCLIPVAWPSRLLYIAIRRSLPATFPDGSHQRNGYAQQKANETNHLHDLPLHGIGAMIKYLHLPPPHNKPQSPNYIQLKIQNYIFQSYNTTTL